ncbi:MAG: PA0069 family radical SAM protein [Gammaproteobacteria bacterium]|nr:PA0069 family radical SAM protein [Gammaproteobacteria bacterium]
MRKRGFQAPGLDVPASESGAAGRLTIAGRGANSNRASRFLAVHSEAESDGWAADAGAFDPAISPATELYPDRTRTLITRNTSPDIPFDQSINPYKGCEHGCVYCFARPTHAYLDLSPGLDFETRIFYKTRVREALQAELGKPGYRCRTIAMGTNTDPYQPAEKQQRITRTILEVLLEHKHPVSIVTKGQLVLRDLDLLAELARRQLVSVAVSLTTLDSTLKTRLEPRAAGPRARLRMIRGLAEAGVPTAVMVAPVIPFLNDQEIEDMLAAAAAAGARRANYILLRLPLEVRTLFEDWLTEHYPLRAARIMNAIRESRGGKAYDAAWGTRMRGTGVFAQLIARRFGAALKKHGLTDATQAPLRTDLFEPPGARQRSLF